MFWGRLVTSNGGRIYGHVIKWVVVGPIPLKLHPKRFWKKGNLDKIKRNNLKWYISSYLCPKNDLPGRQEAMFDLRSKTKWNCPPGKLFYGPTPSLLEFPGPLTPHPPGISNSLRGRGLDIFWNHTLFLSSIDLVTVFDPILTSRQICEKLQCLYENLVSINFRKTAVLKKISIVN